MCQVDGLYNSKEQDCLSTFMLEVVTAPIVQLCQQGINMPQDGQGVATDDCDSKCANIDGSVHLPPKVSISPNEWFVCHS